MKKLLSLLVCVCMAATFMAIPALATADYSALIEECLTTEVKTAITKDLKNLPTEWSDLPITWKSSNTRVISNDGKVTRPAEDTTVTLTAYQAGDAVKELKFTVIAQGTKVWYSENFYRPSLVGTQIRTSSGAASHPLDFVEKTNTSAGNPGFYKGGGSLAIAENPKKANDYALLAYSTSATDRTRTYFALPNGSLPKGKVTVKMTLTAELLDIGYTKNCHKFIYVNGGAGTTFISKNWLPATSPNAIRINQSNADGVANMTKEGNSYSTTYTTVYDFDNYTAKVTEASNGTAMNVDVPFANTDNDTLKSIEFRHRSDYADQMNGNFYIDDIVITSTQQFIDVPERSTTLKAKWNDTSTSDYYSITTAYNDKYDLEQSLAPVKDLKRVGTTLPAVYEFCEYNNSLDLGSITLKSKSGGSNVTIHAGSDDRTPINTNGSYMGAGHGHTAGVIVTVEGGHGKTHADVGSRWSYDNKIWNLLRIENDTDLLFISDDKGATSTAKYSFHTIAKGTAVTLTHAGTAADNSEAVNKTDISGTVKSKDVQICDAYAPAEVKIYAINGGVKEDVTATINTGTETIEAEQLEFEETYTIMNPAKIAEGLRANRPAGGYTEKPSLAVGEDMVTVKNVYQYNSDGTMLTYMDYYFHIDMGKTSIGGIQYCYASNGDARGFGGGFYKYIPKVKELKSLTAYDAVNGIVSSETIDLDLTQPWRLYVGNRVSGYNIAKSDWEDESNPPNREILYYADNEDPSKYNAAFTLGFLPIGSGDPRFRKDNLTGGAYYLYRTNKGYPTFISVDSIAAGTRYTGVAFKKVQEIIDNGHNYTSVIPVDYEDGKYYYIDYHKSGTDTITLPTTYNYEVVEKSVNVSYTSMDNLITVTADCSDKKYGYLVLKATNAETVRIADGAYDGVMGNLVAYFENDTNSDKTLTAIAATYDEAGKLVETVTFKDFKVEANKDVQKIFPFETKGASAARVFTFNSLNILQAATKSHHIEVLK